MRDKVLNLLVGQDRVSGFNKAIAGFEYFVMEIRKHRDGFAVRLPRLMGQCDLDWTIMDQFFQVRSFLSVRISNATD